MSQIDRVVDESAHLFKTVLGTDFEIPLPESLGPEHTVIVTYIDDRGTPCQALLNFDKNNEVGVYFTGSPLAWLEELNGQKLDWRALQNDCSEKGMNISVARV